MPAFASPYNFSHGTAIFVARTSNEIVVAADSRSVNGNGIPDTKLICKIRRFGDAYIVVNGMSNDKASGYDVFSILNKASRRKGSFVDKITAFESLVKSSLEKALNRLRREDIITFQQNAIDIAPLGVNFFGVEQGTLVLYNRRFVANLSQNNEVSVIIERHSCPGSDCPDGVAFVSVGATEFRERFARENPNFMRDDLVEAARKFVQMQIDAEITDVGAPIDILRITKSGAKWIQRKAECKEPNTANLIKSKKHIRKRRRT
jgi:hypothetical protein